MCIRDEDVWSECLSLNDRYQMLIAQGFDFIYSQKSANLQKLRVENDEESPQSIQCDCFKGVEGIDTAKSK